MNLGRYFIFGYLDPQAKGPRFQRPVRDGGLQKVSSVGSLCVVLGP